MTRENGWYWCRINSWPDKLYPLEWCDEYWQVYDMVYDDDQITVLSPRLIPPKIET